MRTIAVVGVGPGGEEYLTQQARAEIAGAERAYAARRHAHFCRPEALRPLEPPAAALEGIRADWELGLPVAVLVSGDAGLYSMLPLLARTFGRENLRVVPGISAPQALCAKLGVAWQDAKILSGHGRALPEGALLAAAREHASVLLLCDAEHNPNWAAEALLRGGLSNLRMAVGERIGEVGERVSAGSPQEIARGIYDPLCTVRIENPSPERGSEIGLSDEAFVRGSVPMTKREIRAQALCTLRLRPDSVVWDVGAGTGSVSVECARQCPEGMVYAVERNGEALKLIAQNAERFFLPNVKIVPGHAPEAFEHLPPPTHVFLGGTGGELPEILRHVERFSKLRLAATAVTLESAAALMRELARWKNLEASQIAVSRLEPAGNCHLFRAQNPVFLVSADWEGEQ